MVRGLSLPWVVVTRPTAAHERLRLRMSDTWQKSMEAALKLFEEEHALVRWLLLPTCSPQVRAHLHLRGCMPPTGAFMAWKHMHRATA